jgi:hypothetical protein
MEKYKTLIVKMSQQDPSIYQARLNFDILFHIHMPLTLSCLLPLLEVVNALIKFAHLEEMFSFVIL